MDELSYDGAHGGDEKMAAAEEIDRLLAEETRRIQDDDSNKTQLLEDEGIMLGRSSDAAHFVTSDATEPAHAEGELEESVPVAKPRTGPAHLAPRDEDATVLMVAREEKAAEEEQVISDSEVDAPLEFEPEPEPEPEPEVESEPITEPAFDPTVPGVIPVDPTVLRPMARQSGDEYLVVRNTRDYDHDAQSVNVVAGAGNFETIVDHSSRSRRDIRRDPYARSSRAGKVPGEGNSRSKLRPLLAILVIALVLGGGAAVLAYGMELWGGKAVPYVVGESQTTAEERIAEKGLVAEVVAEPADDAIGKVLEQDPESGTRIPEGDKVVITVATNRTMPDVVGMSQADAEKALEAAGAEHIDIVNKPSSEAEGSVLVQEPEAGAAFVSRGTITLTVATPFTVPDVVGKKESDAVDLIKQEGLNPEVTYVVSKDATVRTVVSTSPAAGEIISEGGTVVVNVSTPYPTDIHHLAEFFDHSSQDVDTYLLSRGFAFDKGGIDSLGNAVQIYTSTDQGTITFSSQPYLRWLNLPSEGSSNVLSTGAPIAGVRLECPTSIIPEGFKRKSLAQLAKSCGFKDMSETCSHNRMTLPAGAPAITAKFACGSGRMGDLVWTVLVVGSGSQRRAVATCAKRDLYSSSELAPFGGSLARYMAYQEVYLSPEYQVKIEKKDEKKDDKQDDKEGEKKDDESSGTEDASSEGDNQHD